MRSVRSFKYISVQDDTLNVIKISDDDIAKEENASDAQKDDNCNVIKISENDVTKKLDATDANPIGSSSKDCGEEMGPEIKDAQECGTKIKIVTSNMNTI